MTYIISAVVLLGILILFHEFGHFLFAKLTGVVVEKFSLGFPPIFFSKKIGETEYCVGIPLGGFVKMQGDEGSDSETQKLSGSYSSKKIWQRALIVSGGVIFNIILALVIFFAVALVKGVDEPVYDSAAIGNVGENYPAEKLGIVSGDTILSIDNIPVSNWEEMTEIIQSKPEQMLTFAWKHNNKIIIDSVVTTATILDGNTSPVGMIGVAPMTRNVRVSILQAAEISFNQSYFILEQMVLMIARAVTGRFSMQEVGGPVMIFKMAGETARYGFIYFLQFMAIISLNLAFINLLPFPIFDGGHLVFLFIEFLMRKPVSQKLRLILQQVSIVVIFVLFILITTNDIFRLFR